MAFNAEIRFTGICALVRDEDGDKAALVMPQGWSQGKNTGKESKDGHPLMRHRAFVRFPVHQLASRPNVPPGMVAVHYVNGNQGATAEGAELSFSFTGATNKPMATPAIGALADLDAIAPPFSLVDPDLLSEANPVQRLAARFRFDYGALSTRDSVQTWVTPGTLGLRPIEKRLAHEIVLSLAGLDTLKLKLKDFVTGTKTEIALAADDGGTVDVLIGNLCDDNPLRWETAVTVADLPPDGDFRWYFELLRQSDQELLVNALRNALDLPVPYVSRFSPNGQGVNCFPADTQQQNLPPLR